MIRKNAARRVAIPADLRHECVEPVELFLGPDTLDQLDLDALAIEIARKVEEMRLQQFLGRLELRPDTEIGRAVEHPPVRQPPAHRIDAVSGPEIPPQVDIGGRKAQLPPQLVAVQ